MRACGHLPIKSNNIFDPSTCVTFAPPPSVCHPESNRTAGSKLSTLMFPTAGSVGTYWISSNKNARPAELTLIVNSCCPGLMPNFSHRTELVARTEVSTVRGSRGMLSMKHCHFGSAPLAIFSLLAVPYNRTSVPSRSRVLSGGKQQRHSSYLKK